jgi:CBS domain-containing protein
MEKIANVRELMVPISEYASVGEHETLAEALRALSEAQKRVPAGRQPHRAILVENSEGAIVGKIGHFVVLRALLPVQEEAFREPLMRRAWVNEEMAHHAMENLFLLQGELLDLCERAQSVRVRDLMLREAIPIDADLPLVGAMHALLEHQTLSLLVTEKGKVAGVLRLSDVFDHLSRHILECADRGKK